MKIGLQALKQIYAQSKVADFLPDDINKVIEKIGAQLGEVEEVQDLGKKYEGVIVAKVMSCEKHPNADKLKLCKVDDGGIVKNVERDSGGLVQVVCGAPNVHEGMLAAWLPPGSTVPATFDKEPFVLEARELRGKVSNGMLASPHELAISDDHDGILEIDKKDVKPGDSFAELYKLNTFIIDIENKMFTHRPDCFGLLGVARELAGIYHVTFTSPDWYMENPEFPKAEAELLLEVQNDIPELSPRFCAVAIKDVNVASSPLWLQVMLSKFGIKSVNNIVDLTNFYMLLTGQPLHAYDYDKVAKLSGNGAVIKVRKAQKGEKLKLLNGKEVSPEEGTIMIATDKRPIGIGGVIGGADTEVDSSTKNIILECANFDSYAIRRTSMHHGIFTDAVTRFTKSQSPHQTLAVLAKITNDIAGFTGGKVASELFDLKGKLKSNRAIDVSAGYINERLGLSLGADEIAKLISNVEFKVEKSDENLRILAPFWRVDIEIPEDIVEEVGRLYGYDNLPLVLPRKIMSASQISEELQLKQELRERLSALGANEVLSYSFVHGKLLDAVGQDRAKSFKLKNALSPQLQYYRQGILPSLLEKVHPNIKAGNGEFALFELGKVHKKGDTADGLPEESARLGLVVAGKAKRDDPAFYTARKYLVELLADMNIAEEDIAFDAIEPKSYFLAGRSAELKVNGKPAGHIGEFSRKVSNSLKLPDFCAGFELYLSELHQLAGPPKYNIISRYPATEQDICLRTEADMPYAKIKSALLKSLKENAPKDVNISTECIDIFAKDKEAKQTTFRVEISSHERTLTSEIINLLFDKTAGELKESIKAERV